VEVTATYKATSRTAWRAWLEQHHSDTSEIWLVQEHGKTKLSYLESVEEALCFGWIDGIAKRLDAHRTAQRFTPRKPKSHWTELNKIRARRLIAAGHMTEAGRAVLPDLSPEAFQIAVDIEAALRSDPEIWQNFSAFPDDYKRIRIGYIEEQRRNKTVFDLRLRHFLNKTRQNKQFGGTL
jgi:uncharacterized protein YdeI (YjbR/CyaY-like superfamily)